MYSFATKTDNPNTKLGWNDRIGYGIGNFGMAWVNGMMSAFLMKYLTDVSLVDAGVVSFIIAISKLFDGISDLIMGRIVDSTHSKMGKARVWLLRMSIPLAISTVLLFSIPSSMTGMIKYVYVFIIYNLVNSVCYTAMAVPYNALVSLSTTDTYEHGMLGNIAMIFQTIANICMNTFFMVMVVKFAGVAEPYMTGAQRGWTLASAVVGVIIVLSALVCVFGTKERTVKDENNDQKKEIIPTKDALKSLFSNKYWLLMILGMFVIFFIIVLYSAGAIYYCADVLGDYALYTPVNNALSIAQFAIMFVTPIIMKKFGKHKTYMLGLIATCLGFLGTGLAGANLSLLIVFNVIKGIGLGAAGGMAIGMVADTLEYGQWKDGIKPVGMGNAAISAAQKLGLGLGQVALGAILSFGGYDGGVSVQSESAKAAITFLYNWLPAAMIAVTFVIMLFYTLDKEMPNIHKELEQRDN
ncbi:MAG: glycoside-pentoside-hexuronide (GPH):cation symporter [Lachnospiraceae bacterium]|nr:glycoside-pentoside-hexuronide (GPH):cation symporter [Lachnospiraceae bacterium]